MSFKRPIQVKERYRFTDPNENTSGKAGEEKFQLHNKSLILSYIMMIRRGEESYIYERGHSHYQRKEMFVKISIK